MNEHGLNPKGVDEDGYDYAACKCGAAMEWEECHKCGGDGTVEYADTPEVWGEDSPSEVNHLVDCPECDGTGGWWWCPVSVEEAKKRIASPPTDPGRRGE